MLFRTEITSFKQHQKEIRYIRHKVFVDEQAIDPELEWDELDREAHFVLAFDDANSPVGTARFIDTGNGGHGKISRMAVLAEYRHNGCGECILDTIINWAWQHQLSELRLSAQETAIPFYKKQGFIISSTPYIIAGISHQDMIKRL